MWHELRSAFETGDSRLPYYCTPPVCVPDVIGALAVWRQDKKKWWPLVQESTFQGNLSSVSACKIFTLSRLCLAGLHKWQIWDPGVFTIIIIFPPYWWLSCNKNFSFSVTRPGGLAVPRGGTAGLAVVSSNLSMWPHAAGPETWGRQAQQSLPASSWT